MPLHVGSAVVVPLARVVALVQVGGPSDPREGPHAELMEAARGRGELVVVQAGRAHCLVVADSGKVFVSPIHARRLAMRWTRGQRWRRAR